jgi:hypothetical protein
MMRLAEPSKDLLRALRGGALKSSVSGVHGARLIVRSFRDELAKAPGEVSKSVVAVLVERAPGRVAAA